MKSKIVLETSTEDLKGWNWLGFTDEDGDYKLVENDDDVQAAAKALKLKPEAISAINDALRFMAESIIDHIIEDLEDIWEKVSASKV